MATGLRGGARGFVTDYYVDTRWRKTSDLTDRGIPQCGASTPRSAAPHVPALSPTASLASSPVAVGGVRLGVPANGFHTWGSCSVRDYKHSSQGWVILVVTGSQQYVVARNGMLWGWFDQGGAPGWLGCPTTNEMTVGSSANVISVAQHFTGGWLYWTTGMNHAVPISARAVKAIGWAWRCVAVAGSSAPCSYERAVPNYYYRCLGFVVDAYRYGAGVAPVGGPYGENAEAYQWYVDNASHRGGGHSAMDPPAGTFAVWAGTQSNPAGHIALSIGEGRVITSYDGNGSRIHVESLSNIAPSLYLGWVSPGV